MKRNTEDSVIILMEQQQHQDLLYSVQTNTSMHRSLMTAVGKTLVSASTLQKEVKAELENTDDVKAAEYLGTVIGKKAVAAGIESVVFDRGGYIYHGKIKALADAAREAGLKF